MSATSVVRAVALIAIFVGAYTVMWGCGGSKTGGGVEASAATSGVAKTKYVAVVETEIDAQSGAAAELNPAEIRQITAALRREAVENLPRGTYNIMTSETVIAQGGAVLEECADENCVILLGSKIGADYIVRGIVSKLQTRFTLSVEMYETENGNLVATAAPVRSENIGELVDKAAWAVADMYRKFVNPKGFVPRQEQPVAYTAPVAPSPPPITYTAPVAPPPPPPVTYTAPVAPTPPPVTYTAPVAPLPPSPKYVEQLVITSNPSGATVEVDGRRVGVTPYTFKPSTWGDITITVSMNGYERATKTVEFEGGTLHVPFSLSRVATAASSPTPQSTPTYQPTATYGGHIFIASLPPKAEVYVDGKYVGMCNEGELQVPVGTHQVRFVKDGLEKTETLTFDPGKNMIRFVNMRP